MNDIDRFERAMRKLSGDTIIAADRNNTGMKTVFAVWVPNAQIPEFLRTLEHATLAQPDRRRENLAEGLTGGD